MKSHHAAGSAGNPETSASNQAIKPLSKHVHGENNAIPLTCPLMESRSFTLNVTSRGPVRNQTLASCVLDFLSCKLDVTVESEVEASDVFAEVKK